MKVTFYVGDYTRKTGKVVKGQGDRMTSEQVERVRIDGLPGGEVIDRPVSKKDKETEAYLCWKDPARATPPQQDEESAKPMKAIQAAVAKALTKKDK